MRLIKKIADYERMALDYRELKPVVPLMLAAVCDMALWAGQLIH